jgi:hypothetical protein
MILFASNNITRVKPGLFSGFGGDDHLAFTLNGWMHFAKYTYPVYPIKSSLY